MSPPYAPARRARARTSSLAACALRCLEPLGEHDELDLNRGGGVRLFRLAVASAAPRRSISRLAATRASSACISRTSLAEL